MTTREMIEALRAEQECAWWAGNTNEGQWLSSFELAKRMEELLAEVERLIKDHGIVADSLRQDVEVQSRLRADNERLRECLRWYDIMQTCNDDERNAAESRFNELREAALEARGQR